MNGEKGKIEKGRREVKEREGNGEKGGREGMVNAWCEWQCAGRRC